MWHTLEAIKQELELHRQTFVEWNERVLAVREEDRKNADRWYGDMFVKVNQMWGYIQGVRDEQYKNEAKD